MIRLKNIDFESAGMKRQDCVLLGDVTATLTYNIFVAPVACVIEAIKLVSTCACPPATLTASTTNNSATIQAIINGTATVMAARGTSATAVDSNSISANVPWVLIPTAANSLTQGTPVQLVNTIGGSGVLSSVLVQVVYRPLKHRETR